MKLRIIFLAGILILMMVATACGAAPTQVPTPTTTPTLTDTPQPSDTPSPTLTQTATPTLTFTPTATLTVIPSETPRPNFAGFKVDYAELVGFGMTIRFLIPGNKQAFRLTVNGIDFQCTLNDQTPDRLYCSGKQFGQGQSLKLVFLAPAGDNTPIFETTYKVALAKTATPDPRTLAAQAGPGCPQRGQNVRGEIEWRKYNGGYCVVATCFDACGYYYSLNTCPTGTDHNGIYLFPGATPAVCH